jgi:hypothetical protein
MFSLSPLSYLSKKNIKQKENDMKRVRREDRVSNLNAKVVDNEKQLN